MTSPEPLRVVVAGCGLIGSRRAREAAAHPGTDLVAVCDIDEARAVNLAGQHGGRVFRELPDALASTRPDIAVVATTNSQLMPNTMAALEVGAHVLVEKPMGKNLHEARCMARAAESAKRTLKVGFNLRFHPAIRKASQLVAEGSIGTPCFARCTYGHGGRPGLEDEWRADPRQSGGGELLDQGVHVLDLLRSVFGNPCSAFAELASLFWPIGSMEDNAFALLRYSDGQIASIHTSWTQWMNRFHWQVYGDRGAVEVHGLGGSYGLETLTVYHRKSEGGVPDVHDETFPGPDRSWGEEWTEFIDALQHRRNPSGHAKEGVEVMRVLDALYRSAENGAPTVLSPP